MFFIGFNKKGKQEMKVPETYKGMKLVQDYPKQKYARYTNGKWNECFSYYELGERTPQIVDRKINVDMHL